MKKTSIFIAIFLSLAIQASEGGTYTVKTNYRIPRLLHLRLQPIVTWLNKQGLILSDNMEISQIYREVCSPGNSSSNMHFAIFKSVFLSMQCNEQMSSCLPRALLEEIN